MTEFRCIKCHKLLFRYIDKSNLIYGAKGKYITSVIDKENVQHLAKLLGKEIVEIKCSKCKKVNVIGQEALLV